MVCSTESRCAWCGRQQWSPTSPLLFLLPEPQHIQLSQLHEVLCLSCSSLPFLWYSWKYASILKSVFKRSPWEQLLLLLLRATKTWCEGGKKCCLEVLKFVCNFYIPYTLDITALRNVFHCYVGRRRQWHPTPVLLLGKSHGRRSLVGCSPWGRKELDTTERLHCHFSLPCVGEGNGNPLQCSCLENPRDGGAW